ncbi:MAG: pilus assembly protein PilM, partial [Patescibacteria group bacterium]|nr:pilus assembly protein PilM [Patescibacteria group bacterium]
INNTKTAILVSIGAQTTDLAILHSGTIAFTRSISAGGEGLSRALIQVFGLKQNQAEEFKKAYGLDKRHLEGKIVEAVKPVMDIIISEIKRAFVFYQEKSKVNQIDFILLSGGTAQLPGIASYFSQHIGIEAQLADPWIGIRRDQKFSFLDSEGVIYTVAVGLARR